MQSLFKVLSSETRLEIVKLFVEKGSPRCYCDYVEDLGKEKSVIYRHFKKLEDAGVIETFKKGKKLSGRLKNPEKIERFLELAEEVSNDED